MKKLLFMLAIFTIGMNIAKAETVYTTTRLNIRTCASIKCKRYKTVNKNTKLNKVGIKNGWAKIKINNKIYYAYNTYLKGNKKTTTTKKKPTKTTQVKQTYVSTNVNEMKNYAHNLVMSYGWTEEDYNAWVQIINHESSWRVNAENPKSHAYGLCQSLPGSKMASAGSDWKTNYKTQLNWCASYIKGRYGTPSSAWNFWQQHHWY